MARRKSSDGSFELRAGPFRGVFDSDDMVAGRTQRLYSARNCYIPDLQNGSAVLQRHGFLGLAGQLGTSTGRVGQCVYLHRRLDGTLDRLFVVGGVLYRWDGDATFTDITPAGISIEPTNPVFMVSFNDRVVVSDGHNKPWLLNPYDDTGVEIELDDLGTSYSLQGPPVAYAGKVFGILKATGGDRLMTEAGDLLITEQAAADHLLTELGSGFRNTLIWSLEADATTGYDQADYDYTWQLTQSSSELLSALYADEGMMLYFRVKGIGSITGSTVDDFKAQATRDAVHASLGTDAPAAVIAAGEGRKVFFVDLDGRVHMVPVGGQPRQLWYPTRQNVSANAGLEANRTEVARYARAAYHEGYNLVLFTIWSRREIHAFDADTGTYVGVWNGPNTVYIDAMGATVDAAGRSCFVLLGSYEFGFGDPYDHTLQGVVWRQKYADDDRPWIDERVGVDTLFPFTRAVETHYLVSESARRYRALEVSAELRSGANAGGTLSDAHDIILTYTTPTTDAAQWIEGGQSAPSNTETSIARWTLGRNAQGSAIRFAVLATDTPDYQWGIHDLTVRAIATDARRGAR